MAHATPVASDIADLKRGECESRRVETNVLLALGVRGCPKPTLPKSAKYFEILVSAAGFEPATHALKGHCSTN